MYQIIFQEQNKIELLLAGELTEDEFRQVVHQLESLCAMYQKIHILFDAAGLENYQFKIIWDEFDFYKKYKHHLERVALVTKGELKIESFLMNMFNKFTDTEWKTFTNDQITEARKWIFPSRLP